MVGPMLIRSLSFTASRDWLYRFSFSHAGLQSVTSDLGDGTTMHCWIPKVYKPTKPNLLLVHGFGANAMWQYSHVVDHFIPKYNVSNYISHFFHVVILCYIQFLTLIFTLDSNLLSQYIPI